jgi:hypothetical protein
VQKKKIMLSFPGAAVQSNLMSLLTQALAGGNLNYVRYSSLTLQVSALPVYICCCRYGVVQ